MKTTFTLRPYAALALGLLFLLNGSCTSQRMLSIDSVEHPNTSVTPRLKENYYRVDRDRNLYFALQSSAKDPQSGQPIEQIILVRMFWQPKGGQTTLNPEALNATFRYIVMTPKAVGMYEGAGFVRIYKKVGKEHMTARILDGDLRLTEASRDFNDNLGRSVFHGSFTAKLSDVKTFDMTAEAQRQFFSRSLVLGKRAETQPATQATSQPATGPAENAK
jgi:hypothetical protein